MAAVASSSTPSGSRPAQRPRKNDVFKPRFPFDPFSGAAAAALGEPWFLKIDALLTATAYQRRNVILVLGAPSLRELAPLLQSRHLTKSLVILATHNPPDIPHIVLPTVRILHLSAPLALEDAGAVRFVNVLEWAERIARAWRKHGGSGVLELSEELDIGAELAPPSVLRFNGSQSTPASPGSSTTQLSSDTLSSSSRPSSILRPHSSSSGNLLLRSRQASQSLPKPDPSQRPFDALINFLPGNVSDKALLKNSILVTTISRPFLVSNGPAPPPMRERTTSSSSSSRFRRPQSIFNAFSRSSTSVYLPPTPPYQSGESLSLLQLPPPPPTKSLLIHLLPSPPANAPIARRKLAVSPGSAGIETLERARPYLMEATTFCDTVGCEPGVADYGDWTVADVVLSGVLDVDGHAPGFAGTKAAMGAAPGGASAGKGSPAKMKMPMAKSMASRRAWLAAAADVVIMPATSSDESSPSAAYPDGTTAQSLRPGGARPDSYFPHQQQHYQYHQTNSLPRARAFEKGGRSSSVPLLSASDGGPNSGRPHSHPQTAHHRSFSSALSKELPPTPASQLRGRDGASPPPMSGGGGLPTPPHSSEESEECGSLADAPTSGASTPGRGAESAAGSSLSGSGASGSVEESGKRRQRWKFWRRLSHVPAAVKA
ncbi:hypothetical protein BD414DRAFT_517831 [Trametes punicea]|nr:hypothetical protein BD414DRAFT_517831 [Trametes punicea]